MWKLVQMGSGVIYKLLSKSPSTKKIMDQLIKNGGKPIKLNQVPKGTKPTAVTPGNVAGILKNSRTGAGRPAPKPKPQPKPKAKTPAPKPKTDAPSKPQGAGGGNTSGVKPKPKTAKPETKPAPKKPEAPKTDKAPKVTTKPKPKPKPKTKTKPKTERSLFGKKTKKQRDAEAKKTREQAEAMKKPNRSSDSGKFKTKDSKPSSVPKTGGAKKGGLKSRMDAKAKKALLSLGVTAIKADNISQDDIEVGPVTPRPPKAKNPNAARKAPMKVKKKIPVVKADPNPIKVKPNESDQPKNKKPTMRPKQRPAAGPVSDESFGKAFKRNRADGEATFPWKGKQYSTRFKEESVAEHKKKFGDY